MQICMKTHSHLYVAKFQWLAWCSQYSLQVELWFSFMASVRVFHQRYRAALVGKSNDVDSTPEDKSKLQEVVKKHKLRHDKMNRVLLKFGGFDVLKQTPFHHVDTSFSIFTPNVPSSIRSPELASS